MNRNDNSEGWPLVSVREVTVLLQWLGRWQMVKDMEMFWGLGRRLAATKETELMGPLWRLGRLLQSAELSGQKPAAETDPMQWPNWREPDINRPGSRLGHVWLVCWFAAAQMRLRLLQHHQ